MTDFLCLHDLEDQSSGENTGITPRTLQHNLGELNMCQGKPIVTITPFSVDVIRPYVIAAMQGINAKMLAFNDKSAYGY